MTEQSPWKRGWVILGALAVVVTIVGLIAANRASSPPTMTVSGTVELADLFGYFDPGDSCESSAAAGMPVTIYNDAGTIVGATSLKGEGSAVRSGASSYSRYADACDYPYSISDVPTDSKFYRVVTGGGSSTGVTYNATDITKGANIKVS